MAKLEQRPKIDLDVVIRLNEAELRALDALVGYGDEAFLKVFYKHLGEHYMRPHEAGLRSLFKTMRELAPPILQGAKEARKAFVLGLEP